MGYRRISVLRWPRRFSVCRCTSSRTDDEDVHKRLYASWRKRQDSQGRWQPQIHKSLQRVHVPTHHDNHLEHLQKSRQVEGIDGVTQNAISTLVKDTNEIGNNGTMLKWASMVLTINRQKLVFVSHGHLGPTYSLKCSIEFCPISLRKPQGRANCLAHWPE